MSGWSAPERDAGDVKREAVRVTFTLTEEDLRRGIKDLPATRRILGMWGIGFVLLPVALWLTGGPRGPDVSASVLGWLLPMGFLGVMFWYFVAIAPAKRQHRSMKEGERNITYEFTPNGFSSESTGASGRVDYSRVHRFVDAKHSLLIYVNPYTPQVVPKRVLSPGELETVLRWLRDEVRPRRSGAFVVRALVLWVVLIVVFLAMWQLLAPGSP